MYFSRGGRNPWNPQYTIAPLNDNESVANCDVCPVWRHTMGNQLIQLFILDQQNENPFHFSFLKCCISSAAVIKDIQRDKMFIAFGCKTVNCSGDGTKGNAGFNNKILRYDDRYGHKDG